MRGERAIERVRDVLLIPRLAPAISAELRAHPPAGDPPVPIWAGLWLRAPDPDLCDLMREPFAGAPRASPDAGFHYMLVSEAPAGDPRAHDRLFDENGDIMAALGYSRLIRVHHHTPQYAARVIDYDDASSDSCRMLTGVGAVRRHVAGRDWLDRAEARELAQLLAPVAPGRRRAADGDLAGALGA